MLKRYLAAAALTAALAVMPGITAYGGQWKQGTGENAGKWWYDEENGAYGVNGWRWIDGNGDGVAECYCFDQNGWLYVSTTTPDRKTVNENGAWVENGAVVTKDLNTLDDGSGIAGAGTLEAKTYEGIEFSIENLGVSDMAIGSILYPKSNTATARVILENKQYYENGTDSHWMNQAQKSAVEDFISRWKEQYISSSMSDEEICRAIYHWLTQNVTYDSSAPNPQSSYGALIERRCVCGGFANTFVQLGKACGLDVKFLMAPNHSLNLVNISGKWYAVDATQKRYKDGSTVGVYYMHTIPEGDRSLEERAAKRNEAYANRSQEIAGDNERNSRKESAARQEGAVFQADDENLIPSILDCLYGQIIGKNSSQEISMIVYTGGRNFQAFNKLEYSYNGKSGRLDHVIEEEMIGQSVNGFTIGDTSSCSITLQKNTGTGGASTFVTTWKDEAGSDYVILSFNINPQR